LWEKVFIINARVNNCEKVFKLPIIFHVTSKMAIKCGTFCSKWSLCNIINL
jgi:hypothetical protein